MTGPGPPGPRSPIGEAGTERLLGLLREHYARGRFDLDEFSRRVGVVLAAAYADQAASAVADLPPLELPAGGRAVAGRPGRGGRRHAQADKPGPGWVPTPERFRDPSSGKIIRVWLDPADQSRHYVPDRQATPP
jgi:hypothetical protein